MEHAVTSYLADHPGAEAKLSNVETYVLRLGPSAIPDLGARIELLSFAEGTWCLLM